MVEEVYIPHIYVVQRITSEGAILESVGVADLEEATGWIDHHFSGGNAPDGTSMTLTKVAKVFDTPE